MIFLRNRRTGLRTGVTLLLIAACLGLPSPSAAAQGSDVSMQVSAQAGPPAPPLQPLVVDLGPISNRGPATPNGPRRYRVAGGHGVNHVTRLVVDVQPRQGMHRHDVAHPFPEGLPRPFVVRPAKGGPGAPDFVDLYAILDTPVDPAVLRVSPSGEADWTHLDAGVRVGAQEVLVAPSVPVGARLTLDAAIFLPDDARGPQHVALRLVAR